MTSSDSGPEALPETIQVGKGMTMVFESDLRALPSPLDDVPCLQTFLRDQPYLARIRISGEPDAETLYVPPHWHETHDEFLRVLEGQLEVTLGPITRMYGPHDGEIAIRRGVSHCLRSLKGVECIFEERTDPMVGAGFLGYLGMCMFSLGLAGQRKGGVLSQYAREGGAAGECVRSDAGLLLWRYETCAPWGNPLVGQNGMDFLHDWYKLILRICLVCCVAGSLHGADARI